MPCSQPGPSVSGRKIPDSSSSGTTIVLISGANASSLLTSRPVAYDTDASPMATSTMNPNPMNTAATGARSPNATPTSTTTPPRQSEMMAKPTNVEPNSPSWMSSPGTKNR